MSSPRTSIDPFVCTDFMTFCFIDICLQGKVQPQDDTSFWIGSAELDRESNQHLWQCNGKHFVLKEQSL